MVFVTLSGNSQSCLPDGIVFTSQSQIDSFKTNYPNCSKIQGPVRIEGSTINDLNGLNEITSIGEHLEISLNLTLKNLDGLNNLDTIGNYLLIENHPSLKNINGLESLEYVGGLIYIGHNDSLIDLSGLENIDSVFYAIRLTTNLQLESLKGLDSLKYIANGLYLDWNTSLKTLEHLKNLKKITGILLISFCKSLKNLDGIENVEGEYISELRISENDSLSSCAVESICEYLADPNGLTGIHNNNDGCNTIEEVEQACLTGELSHTILGSKIRVYPNPTSGKLFFTTNDLTVLNVNIYDQFGRLVFSENKPEKTLDTSFLSPGFYVIEFVTEKMIVKKKILLEK